MPPGFMPQSQLRPPRAPDDFEWCEMPLLLHVDYVDMVPSALPSRLDPHLRIRKPLLILRIS